MTAEVQTPVHTATLYVTPVHGGWLVSGEGVSVSAKYDTRSEAVACAANQGKAMGLPGFTLVNKLGKSVHYTIRDGKAVKRGVQGALKKKAPEQAAPAPSYAQFEVGKVYSTRSICDHDCIYRWRVVRRTDKSVWVEQFYGNGSKDAPVRRTVSTYLNSEMIYPSGRYSMCPVLFADKDAV